MKGERFYILEICQFLRASPAAVTKFLRREGHLRRIGRGGARSAVYWTTARGVALCVAHFRAIQGEAYQKGKDPLRRMDRKNALEARKKALLKGAGYPPEG